MTDMADGEPLDDLAISFEPSEWGWIDFQVAPLTGEAGVRATHLDDPFEAMIRWLERIVGGAEAARWVINEEGCAAQFVLLAAAEIAFCGPVTAQLCFIRSNERGEVFHLASRPVTALGVVRLFYDGFRRYVEGAAYDADHWEFRDDDEDWPWQGDSLGAMRSPLIEARLIPA